MAIAEVYLSSLFGFISGVLSGVITMWFIYKRKGKTIEAKN